MPHPATPFRGLAARSVALGLLVAFFSSCSRDAPQRIPPERGRVVVLGFDGMDPVLAERWMDEGRLPNFARLRAEGHYQRLATTNPPQSPVAWSSFATGADAGVHGVYDFLRRDPATYEPDFAIAESRPAERNWDVLGWRIPLSDPTLVNRRRGDPFWLAAERAHHPATVLRVPVTYPPDPVTHELAGMGVPDLLGTQGTYTLVTTRVVAGADNGGRVRLVRADPDGRVRTRLDGPLHPLAQAREPLSVALEVAPRDGGVDVALDGHAVTLRTGEWSDWIPLRFSFAGVLGVHGMVRLHLNAPLPALALYVSPIQADPTDPDLPISAPPGYARELARRIGRFHTLGMPEETWSMNQGHLDERAWLESTHATLAEGEAMLADALERRDSELVVKVFVQTDRVSHMFWRGLDADHPLHAESSALARGAIAEIYAQADRILGQTRARLRPSDRLIVLSDHGFASFRRAVHLNRVLAELGYLALAPGASGEVGFDKVDWAHTRAYALGLNSVFLNLRGREGRGDVDPAQAPALKRELAAALEAQRDPQGDAQMILKAYDAEALYTRGDARIAPDLVIGYAPGYRASWQTALGRIARERVEDNRLPWSGDHCIDPERVPGVLFADRAPDPPIRDITQIAGWIERTLEADAR